MVSLEEPEQTIGSEPLPMIICGNGFVVEAEHWEAQLCYFLAPLVGTLTQCAKMMPAEDMLISV